MTKNVSVPKGYKKTELGVIPEDWEVVKLGNYSEKIQYGYTQSSTQEEVGPKFLRITDIQNNSVNWGNVPYCECSDTDYEKYKLIDNDIVFARTGATTGKSFLIQNPPKSVFASYLIKVTTNKRLNPQFVYVFFQTPQYWNQIRSNISGSTQGGVNATKLSNLKILIPSLLEQQKIASILSKVDEQIEQTEQIIEKTELLKKGLMQKLLTKGIGHAEFKTFLFKGQKINMPKSWSISTINSHLVEHKGGAPLKPTDFTEKGIRVLPKKAIAKGGILRIKESEQSYASEEFSKKHKTSIVDKSYLITTLRDLVPSGPNIGLIVKINDENEYLMAQGVYGFKLRDTLDVDFLVQYSNSLTYRKIMNKIMVGSTQVHIRNGDFFNVKIPLPPLDEQQKIASILSKVDSQIQDNQNYLTKLQELKKGLMQDLLTGKVRVCV